MIRFIISIFITILFSAALVRWGQAADLPIWLVGGAVLVLWFLNLGLNFSGVYESPSTENLRSGLADGFKYLGYWGMIIAGYVIVAALVFLIAQII